MREGDTVKAEIFKNSAAPLMQMASDLARLVKLRHQEVLFLAEQFDTPIRESGGIATHKVSSPLSDP